MSGPAAEEPPPRDRPSLPARILAVPLVPFVAAWEIAGYIARGIGPAIQWILEMAGRVVRALATGVRIVAVRLWRLVTWPFRLLGRAIAWVAGELARALLPIVVRAWIIVRTLLKAFVKAIRALWARALVPLRLLARAALAMAIRVGLLLRALARAAWLALRVVGARILVPLRIALRALVSLARRLFLVVRALASLVLRAARAVGRFVGKWLLAPIRRAVTAIVNAAWWLMRQVGSALRRAALQAFLYLVPVGRAIWSWLLVPIGRGLLTAISAARWLVRQVGSLLRWAARTVAAAVRLAWRPVRALGRLIRVAVLVALSVLAWVFRPVSVAWRWATRAVAAATGFATAMVRSAIHTARVAVVLAVHDARNLVRKARGKPALPPPDLSAPSHKKRRQARRKPAPARHISQPGDPLWAARTPPEGGGSVPATRMPRRGWAWAGAAAIIFTLVVGLIISKVGSQRVDSNVITPPAKVIGPPQNVGGSCPLLLPGGPTSTNGEASCGSLSVRGPDTALACAQATHLSAAWNLVGRDTTSGKVETGSSLSFVGNSCRLETPPSQEADVGTPEGGGDVVLILDFVAGRGNFAVGVAARCSDAECVNIEADTLGSAWMAERNGNTWVTLDSLRVKPIRPEANRIVMWLGANTEIGWLDGNVIGTVSVRTGKPAGNASFFISTGDNYNPGPVMVDVQQFVIASLGPGAVG